jgi:hypothetical protein
MVNPIDAEIRRFGKYWEDSFHWDLVSRGVAETRMKIEDDQAPSWEKRRIWQEALNSQLGGIIQDRIGEEMEEFIRQTQRDEWDNTILKGLATARRQDKHYDAKLVLLTFYNDELDQDEKDRRRTSLKWKRTREAIRELCFYYMLSSKPTDLNIIRAVYLIRAVRLAKKSRIN